ncbi:MAG: AraC family transcriptional regulator [Planctomycetota bacterium]|jgi:AraC-like DNA-binding protein|nr:AraC family transcriptional regulator [Planctomycetota bacterium]
MDDIDALVKYFNFKREPSTGSRCIDMGRVHSTPHSRYPPYPEKLPRVYQEVVAGRQLNELHLVYIDSGYGWYKNDAGDSFRVTPDTVLLLYPNTYHAYAPDASTGWSEFWVGCDGSYPSWLIKENAFKYKNNPTRVGCRQELGDDFLQLCRLAKSRHSSTVKAQILGGVINRVLGRIIAIQNNPPTSEQRQYEPVISAVIRHLESNVEGDIAMDGLSALVGMRYDKLSKIFQTAMGMTPHQYYLDKKIKEATELLKAGLSVKETSYRLCFDSPYYFSRLFKKKTGKTPQLFKMA